jgi:hypothetical protein
MAVEMRKERNVNSTLKRLFLAHVTLEPHEQAPRWLDLADTLDIRPTAEAEATQVFTGGARRYDVSVHPPMVGVMVKAHSEEATKLLLYPWIESIGGVSGTAPTILDIDVVPINP